MGNYIPVNKREQEEMLETLGLKSTLELFTDIPQQVVLEEGALQLPEGKSEMEVKAYMRSIAKENQVFPVMLRGAGAYRHYIPAIVPYITAKEEFLTAYTPYQAEISQGILQSIFEYQTMICELTGMEVSNASVYDGASAAAEGIAMCKDRKRQKALIAGSAHPDVIATIKTYCHGADTPFEIIEEKEGKVSPEALSALLDNTIACVYLQYPNFYGTFEQTEEMIALAQQAGAKVVLGCNPLALTLYKTPGEMGADIVVGEGQPLGMPLSYGGPYLGFMAAKEGLTRKLPGRIVGETTDVDGKRAYVLTLQAREQHIRREKASSNICTNQALCAMTASIYMATMGPKGMKEAAMQSFQKAHYFQVQLEKVCGLAPVGQEKFFHEFVTKGEGKREEILSALAEKGMLGGLPVGEDELLWCVTEVVTKDQLDEAVATIKEVLEK
ncbi:MAG: aminomethyl-transferring glycine dehydrogenase subunit GcvPA [Clostridiales bacterium]|nr:aminomethyl-transferring glycine dehydrogenase subunit GcvPA [Clostridiales bacterium]